MRSSVVAAIVPLSEDAGEALKRRRNLVWTMPISQLPTSVKGAIEFERHQEGNPNVITYDVAQVHSGSRKGIKFGRKRTSTVQLLSSKVEDTHFKLTFNTVTRSLTLTNKSTQGLLTSTSPSKELVLTPESTVTLIKPTTVILNRYRFRVYLAGALTGKAAESVLGKATINCTEIINTCAATATAPLSNPSTADNASHAPSSAHGGPTAEASRIHTQVILPLRKPTAANKITAATRMKPAQPHSKDTASVSKHIANRVRGPTSSDASLLLPNVQSSATAARRTKRKVELSPADPADLAKPRPKRIRQEG